MTLTTGVIRFQQGNLNTLFGKVTQLLSQIDRSMVRRSMPYNVSDPTTLVDMVLFSYQFIRKVIFSVDILSEQNRCCRLLVAHNT